MVYEMYSSGDVGLCPAGDIKTKHGLWLVTECTLTKIAQVMGSPRNFKLLIDGKESVVIERHAFLKALFRIWCQSFRSILTVGSVRPLKKCYLHSGFYPSNGVVCGWNRNLQIIPDNWFALLKAAVEMRGAESVTVLHHYRTSQIHKY